MQQGKRALCAAARVVLSIASLHSPCILSGAAGWGHQQAGTGIAERGETALNPRRSHCPARRCGLRTARATSTALCSPSTPRSTVRTDGWGAATGIEWTGRQAGRREVEESRRGGGWWSAGWQHYRYWGSVVGAWLVPTSQPMTAHPACKPPPPAAAAAAAAARRAPRLQARLSGGLLLHRQLRAPLGGALPAHPPPAHARL